MNKSEYVKLAIENIEKKCAEGYNINDILSKEMIEKLLFNTYSQTPSYRYIQKEVFEYLRSRNCDVSGINFDNVAIDGYNFAGFIGTKINPEGRYLDGCRFRGVEFTGPFKNASIRGVDFTGSKNAVISVREVENKSIAGSIMCDVTFKGSFDGADIYHADFTGSKGARINPNKLYAEGLEGVKLCDTELTEAIAACYIDGADFTGSKNAVIIASAVPSFNNTVLKDALVIGDIMNKPCDGIKVKDAIFLPAPELRIVEPQKIKKKGIFEKKNKR